MDIEKHSFVLRTSKPNRVLSVFDVVEVNNILGKTFDTVYVNSMEPGVVAGNHYHKTKEEIFACLFGKLEIYLEDQITKEKEMIILESGNPVLLSVKPGVVHAVKNISNEMAHLIVFSVGKPKEEDAFEYKII